MAFNSEREEVRARGLATSLDASSLPGATAASSLFPSWLCWPLSSAFYFCLLIGPLSDLDSNL